MAVVLVVFWDVAPSWLLAVDPASDVSALGSGNVFITGDCKYHEFFDAEDDLIIADIGHYESEKFTKELIYDHFNEKLTNIALRLSKVNTNPINYL